MPQANPIARRPLRIIALTFDILLVLAVAWGHFYLLPKHPPRFLGQQFTPAFDSVFLYSLLALFLISTLLWDITSRKRRTTFYVIAFIKLFLVLISVPVRSNATERQMRVECSKRLTGVGVAISTYTTRNGRPPASFNDLIAVGASSASFVCPATGNSHASGPTTQAVLAEFAKPGRCCYVYTGPPPANAPDSYVVAYEPPSNHKTGGNVLFADGHVEWVPLNYLQALVQPASARRSTRP